MPNVRRPDRLSISLADKAARAITELSQENDWLAWKVAKLEVEVRELRERRAANDDHRVRRERPRINRVFGRLGVGSSRTTTSSAGTNGER